MIYREFQNLKLSSLGFGTMRLPTLGNDGEIDETKTAEMFDYAIKHGVNYFDTAWGYHNGNSELAVGKILSSYPRESFYLASKFPGYDVSNMDKVQSIFERQLEKCRTEYFDFYLFHNVCEINIDKYLDPKYGILDYLLKQKENGRIKHLGFSVHGSYDTAKRFLEAYGKHMEFCQIQLNYLDYNFQNAKAKLELLKQYGIPVWVMEPVRGGKLARLDEKYEKRLKGLRPDETAPAWAFRFLQSIPEVCVTLSGMSSMEQVKQNVDIFSEYKPLNDEEMKELLAVADDMTKKNTLPCTACHYCTSHCPKGLDIPLLIELYNESLVSNGGFIAPMRISTLPDGKKPSDCIGCRSCEKVCPQQIHIPDALASLAKLQR